MTKHRRLREKTIEMSHKILHVSIVLALSLGGVHCDSAAEEPRPEKPRSKSTSKASADRGGTAKATGKRDPKLGAKTTQRAARSPAPVSTTVRAWPVAEVKVSPDDPEKGQFTLEEATAGLGGTGDALIAEIQTGKGKLTCELFDGKTPITVANFVGLARGKRPWKTPEGKWVTKPAYDGTVFHRVIPGFMIQGGDPTGTGAGQPGYVIPDEIWEGAYHDKPGLLCMANRGANTNGAQFFVMDGKAAHLDAIEVPGGGRYRGGYTIFGMCEPISIVKEIANVERTRDRAKDPVKIEKVTIKRGKKKPAPESSATPAKSAAPGPSAAPKPSAN